MTIPMSLNWKITLEEQRSWRMQQIEHLAGKVINDVEFTLLCICKNDIPQIDEAIYRCENGDYGRCERCGKTISLERLKVLPWTTLCAKCAYGNSNARRDQVQ